MDSRSPIGVGDGLRGNDDTPIGTIPVIPRHSPSFPPFPVIPAEAGIHVHVP